MSYVVESPVAPAAAPRRPATVTIASTLLAVMGVGGFAYAIATLSITPGVVERFRDATSGADSTDVDGLVTVLWIAAALGMVLAVILLALYVVLGLGVRRGSNASRIGAWVVSGLGLLAGCGSTATVLIQRSGEDASGTIGSALVDAYPGGWIGLNVALAIAQMIGYAAVALLLLMTPGTYFGRAEKPKPDPYAAQPGYGPPSGFTAPGYGPPAGGPAPGYGPPSGYGPPAGAPAPGYGPPSGYGPPVGPPAPGYGPPPGYAQPPGYGSPPGYDPAAYQPPPGYIPPAGSGSPVADPRSGPVSGQPVDSSGYPSSQDSTANPPGPASAPPAGPHQPGPDDDYWSRPSS